MDGTKVALTIDTDTPPFKVLLIRGTARDSMVDGSAREWDAATNRVFGEAAGRTQVDQAALLCPRMARIFITPAWVGMLDFETRFPSRLEAALGPFQRG